MSARRCAHNCARARERRRRALEENEHVQTYHRSGTWTSTTNSDYDYEVSDSTEYQSLPGRNSTPSRESRPREFIDHVETPAHGSERILNESSMCLSGYNNSHHSTHKSKKDNSYKRSPKIQRDESQSSRDPRTSSRSGETQHHTHHQVKYTDERKQRKCPNDDCSPPKYGILFRQKQTSESEDCSTETETQSEISESESLVCPELCERDLLLIPRPNKTCGSSCPKQAWLDTQREKQQAKVDRYMLNKGLNYFEDLCHCSLKCLMTQICMDPFVKKTAASAAFFFLGIKLCFELDSWYIPF